MNLAKEWRTFKAIFVRNMKLFVSYKAWVVATIIWPIPLLALNIYAYKALGTEAEISQALLGTYGIASMAGMVIIGTIVYLLYNRLLWGTGVSIQWERWMGTIESLFVTPASRMTILLASGMSSMVEGSWWIACIFVISWLMFGAQLNLGNIGVFIVSLISTIIALIAIGVFFAGFFVLTRAADQLATTLQAPIRFFSGVVYPVSALPVAFQYVSYIIPVTYGIQALRKVTLLGGGILTVASELLFLYVFAAAFFGAAYVALRILERAAKKKGSLYTF